MRRWLKYWNARLDALLLETAKKCAAIAKLAGLIGSNSQQNNSEWGVKMFFIGIIAAFFIIIGIGYPLCTAIIYPIYRLLGGKQSFFDYMKDV